MSTTWPRPACSRLAACARAAPGATSTMSDPVRRSRSGIWPWPSSAWSATGASWCGMPPSPTAPRASCWIARAWRRWAGAPASAWRTALPAPTSPTAMRQAGPEHAVNAAGAAPAWAVRPRLPGTSPRSACVSRLRQRTFWTVRAIMPPKVFLGPSSRKSSMPALCMAVTSSAQRTGLVSCATKSPGMADGSSMRRPVTFA